MYLGFLASAFSFSSSIALSFSLTYSFSIFGNSDKSVKRKNSRKETSGNLQGNVLEKFSPPLKKFKFPILTESTTQDGSPAPTFISDFKTRLLS